MGLGMGLKFYSKVSNWHINPYEGNKKMLTVRRWKIALVIDVGMQGGPGVGRLRVLRNTIVTMVTHNY